MEFYGNGGLWSFVDEEQRIPQSPNRLSFKTHQQVFECDLQLSPTRPSSASTSLLPSTPSSPWIQSPPRLPCTTRSLLYQCVASLHRHDGNIFSIAISNGSIFTGSESKNIRVWKQPECMECGRIKTSSGHVRAMLTCHDTIFTAHKDNRIRIWKIFLSSNQFQSKKVATFPKNRVSLPFTKGQFDQHKDNISCLAYYHVEGLLYTGSWDKTVKVWNLATKKCIDSFVAHDDNINAVVVDQEDGTLFTSSADGSIKIWRRVSGDNCHTLALTLKFQASSINALTLSNSQDSNFLYSGSSDGLINYWEKEVTSGRYNHAGFLHGHRFSVLCLASVGGYVFSGSEDTTIRVWNREERNRFHVCLAVMEGHLGPVRCVAASVEMERVMKGFLVYSASMDRTVKVWRVKVFAGEKKIGVEEGEKNDVKVEEYEMSPVLSPSWVAKKLKGL